MPWAYLAILNSGPFESLLRLFCPRVQGGQYNLSRRFVESIPIPDLSDENQSSSDLVQELSVIGKELSLGLGADGSRLSELVNVAYGLRLDDLNRS